MKVFFDIITNHTADVIDYTSRAPVHATSTRRRRPTTTPPATSFDDRDYAGHGPFPALDAAPRSPTRRTSTAPPTRRPRSPAWLNDPTLLPQPRRLDVRRRVGRRTATSSASTTSSPSSRRSSTAWTTIYKTWVDFGIDGFRIDTAKHVNIEFWQQFSPAMLDHAKRRSATTTSSCSARCSTPTRRSSASTRPGQAAGHARLRLPGARRRFANGKADDGLRDLYAGDDYYTDTDSNAYNLPTFLGNHDMGRIGMLRRRRRSPSADPASLPTR